jgi:MFS superfamily sulfate permease-like transporter
VAVLALLVIAVPEQLATTRLAGMPPITGLYAFVAGTIAFAVFGRNARLSVGADSTTAPLFAAALARFAPTGSAHYVALAGILAVVVGIFVAGVGLLRLGWIAEFLSAPIIAGFLAGVAVIIVVHQLPDVLGLAPTSGSTVHRVGQAISHLGNVNGWALGIALGVLAVALVTERLDRRLPGTLVGLVGSMLLVAGAGLGHHGVAVLGTVSHAAPHLGLRDLSWTSLGHVTPIAAVVALVVVSQSAATTSAFAGDRPADADRDFLGVGAGSVVAGLTGSFPVNASPPRTAVLDAAGVRTKIPGLAAAAVVVVLVPAAGVLRDVPLCTLGAILVFVGIRLFHVRELVSILRFDLVEFGLAVVTLLTVALIGVEQGIGVAVGLAILDRARLSARPSVHVMGLIPGTTSWAPVERPGTQAEVPGVVVVLFAAPLYYVNAEHFRTQMSAALGRGGAATRALVLDVVGMHDMDFTGSLVLTRLLDELSARGIGVGMARAGDHLVQNLERAGLLERIGRQHLYPSVDEAVRSLAPSGG